MDVDELSRRSSVAAARLSLPLMAGSDCISYDVKLDASPLF